MRQVHDYIIMDTFLENDLQCISMGTHSKRTNEIALINEIEKDTLISPSTFNALTKHLTNLQFSNSDSKYTLITLYNEGVPFPTFMQNYKLQNEERRELLLRILNKIENYNELPEDILSLLIDENQIIISDEDILLNEIINLDKYDTSVTFQDSLKIILEKVLDLCDAKPCYDINEYLSSDQFYQAASLSEIIDSIRELVNRPMVIAEAEAASNETADLAAGDDVKESQPLKNIEGADKTTTEPFVYKLDVELDDEIVPSYNHTKMINDALENETVGSEAIAPEHSAEKEATELETADEQAAPEPISLPIDNATEFETPNSVDEIELEEGKKSEQNEPEIAAESETDKARQAALEEFLKFSRNNNSTERAKKSATLHKEKTTNKTSSKTKKRNGRKKAYKTRAQRRRRLLWLIIVILIVVLLKFMWPQ